MAPIRYLTKAMPSLRQLNLRFVSSSAHLRQEAQLSDVPPPPQTTMPPNPASSTPIHGENEAQLSDVSPPLQTPMPPNLASGTPIYGENEAQLSDVPPPNPASGTPLYGEKEAQLSDVRTPLQTPIPPNLDSGSTMYGENEPQLSDAPPPPQTTMPPNPAFGSPMYGENWRNANSYSPAAGSAAMPIYLGLLHSGSSGVVRSLASTLDAKGLMDQFAKWTTEQRWAELKQLFELWIKSLDNSGKPNKPDVNLYNHYLRANLMNGASTMQLIDLVEQMTDYGIAPNTASFNLVLKSMQQAEESLAAEKLIERMLQQGQVTKECLPDDESYDLIISLMLSLDRFDCAMKYINLALASGYMMSMNAFSGCVHNCIKNGKLDTLVSLIEKCKKMDQNKSLCPPWQTCNYLLDVAMQLDNSDLTYYALEFMAKWIARGEIARPPVLLSVNEGLVLSALGTAGRTCNSKLVDGSWAVLKRSLRQKSIPTPECYVGKIFAHANSGNLQKAFSTLHEFEIAYRNSSREDIEDLFSPFHTLNPLVIACSKKGFRTLDMVYHQLEVLGKADPPYKSVAALNCIILGSANIWDVDRAYQTFAAIDSTFGLTPDIHSYNALLFAFGKLGKRDEAVRVFEHFTGSGVKPNMTSYSLLVDAQLVARDPKAAVAVIDDMIKAGFEPAKRLLKKVRRRCLREMDYESDDKVEALAQQFKIVMGSEARRNILFEVEHNLETYICGSLKMHAVELPSEN